jgi:hypothetical protein
MKNPNNSNISDKILDKIQYIFDQLDPLFTDYKDNIDFTD